jgi:hypothetical protein
MRGPHGLASGARKRAFEEDDEHHHFEGTGSPPPPEKPTFPPKPKKYKKGYLGPKFSSRDAADILAKRQK